MGSYSLAKTPSDHRCGKPSLARAFETLGPNAADLGPLIQARVPLHMHQQLDDVCDPWFYFWKEEHWIAAQRRKNRRGEHDKQQYVYVYREEPRNSGGEELPPHVVTRFFLGCMSQPLDSISHGCNIRHHTWCFYQCPATSFLPSCWPTTTFCIRSGPCVRLSS